MTGTLSIQNAIIIVGTIAAVFSTLTLSLIIFTCWYRCNKNFKKNLVRAISISPETVSLEEEKASEEEAKSDSNEKASSPSITAPEDLSNRLRLPKVLLETRDDREDINGESITRPSRVTIRSDSRRLAHDQTLYAESKSILTADSCKMAARSLHSTITKQPSEKATVLSVKKSSMKQRLGTSRTISTKNLLDRGEEEEEEDVGLEMTTYKARGLTKLESHIKEHCMSEYPAINSKISPSPTYESKLESPVNKSSGMVMWFSPSSSPEAEIRYNLSEHSTRHKPTPKKRKHKTERSISTKPLVVDDVEVEEEEVEATSEAWTTTRRVSSPSNREITIVENIDDWQKTNADNFIDTMMETDV